MGNFGIFIEDVDNTAISKPSFELANKALGLYEDVSLFFTNIGPKPTESEFGIFNSTGLWFFHGDLLVTYLEGLKFVNNIVNHQRIYFYFDIANFNKDLFGLLQNLDRVAVIAKDKKSFDYIQQKTGVEPIGTCNQIDDVLSVIRGVELCPQ